MYSCTDGDRVPQISRGRGRLASESMQTLDLMRYAMTSPSHMGLNDYGATVMVLGGLEIFNWLYSTRSEPMNGQSRMNLLITASDICNRFYINRANCSETLRQCIREVL